jgi:hypothetical protein
MGIVSVLALGVFLGVRHATDADHVVAISTIVSHARSLRAALSVGAFWGIGHTLTVLLVGGAIVWFELSIPPQLGLALELLVALMLIALGVVNVKSKTPGPEQAEQHARLSGQRRVRSLLVGVVHGLAGSAALALLVLTTIPEPIWALVYLAVFGLGTILGMALVTTLVALPFSLASRRFGSFEQTLARVTGIASVVFGVFLVYQIGFVEGLFLADASWSAK